jgi:hypothetical protein
MSQPFEVIGLGVPEGVRLDQEGRLSLGGVALFFWSRPPAWSPSPPVPLSKLGEGAPKAGVRKRCDASQKPGATPWPVRVHE